MKQAKIKQVVKQVPARRVPARRVPAGYAHYYEVDKELGRVLAGIGKLIYQQARKADYSKLELSGITGMAIPYVTNVLNGSNEFLTVRALVRIARGLKKRVVVEFEPRSRIKVKQQKQVW